MTCNQFRVSDKTCWTFVSLEATDGRVGWGEASLNGMQAPLLLAAERLSVAALQTRSAQPQQFAAALQPRDLPEAAIVSAIDHALWDLHAQAAGITLAQALGGARHGSIPIYANINRRTIGRSPADFAQSARNAIAAGYGAIKIAPFDEVDPARCASGAGHAALDTGLARIAAVRAAIGPNCRLMVDCHWRFDEATASALIRAIADQNLYWIECPIAEIAVNIPSLKRLRRQANAVGIRLAGLEQGIGVDAFRPYCEAGAYDVMMPDVKYVGGLRQTLEVAALLRQHGIDVSPHNPTGPVSHAISLHVAAAIAGCDSLELQYDESDLFDALAAGTLPARINGRSALPTAPGLGLRLDARLLARHADAPVRSWDAA